MTADGWESQQSVEGAGARIMDRALLRILGPHGEPVGVGFLVTEDRALTCAHVVSAALGLPEGQEPGETARLQVDLPLVPGAGEDAGQDGAGARIELWGPGLPQGPEDVAVLRLPSPPAGTRPVRLVEGRDLWSHPARTFGLPAGRPGGVWHSGLLRARQADGWVQLDLASSGYRVSRGFSGSPVWDEELCGVVGMVAVAESGEPPASYLLPSSALAEAWPPLRELALPPSPFRGLTAFRETDAAVFHGRTEETEEIARLVAAGPGVCLVGSSGSGKSSLVMAGVVPRLRSEGYAVAVLRPGAGRDPLSALAVALLPLLGPDVAESERAARVRKLSTLLAEGSLADVVAGVLRTGEVHRLLIVVDQLEELFVADAEAIDRFARVLFDTASLPPEVRVLSTLRADFLQTALDHHRIGPALPRKPCVLRPMGPGQLRQVVTAPVDDVPSVSYQPGLTERILADAGATPGALPLLGLTLDLLWQRQQNGLLTHRAYEELGRVAGALGQHADQVWAECVPDEDAEAAQRLLSRLIQLPMGSGAVTRRTALRSDLSEDEWRVAQRLAATRLLVIGRSTEDAETVELAHESLITAWPRLADWVAENRLFLDWREALRHDMERWETGGRTTDLLPNPATVASAEPWLGDHAADLTSAELDYLARGRAHHRSRTRRRRWFFGGLAVVTTLALLLSVLLAFQRQESRERQALADSRALAQLSSDQAKTDPVESTMLALAAYRAAPTSEADNALLHSYVRYAGSTRQLSGLPDTLGGYQASDDGEVVLARSEGGKALLYVHAATGRLRVHRLSQSVQALYPLVSRDGSRAGYVDLDGSVVWYRVNRSDNGAPVVGSPHRLPAAEEVTRGLYDDHRAAFSPDGHLVAAASDTHVVWWDLDHGRIGGRIRAPHGIDSDHALWFGADNRTVLVAAAVGGADPPALGLVAVDRLTRTARPVRTAAGGAEDLLVSGDDTTAVTCREHDGRALYSARPVAGGPELRGFSEPSDFCGLEGVDKTGRRAVLEDGNNVRLVDLARGKVLSRVYGLGAGDSEIGLTYVSVRGIPTIIGMIDNRLSFTTLPSSLPIDIHTAGFTPGGKTMVGVVKGGSRIQVRSVKNPGKVLAEERRPKPYLDTYLKRDHVVLNDHGTLVADRDGQDSISVRRVATLRRTARITPAAPPPATGAEPALVCFFDRSGHLVTVSGTVVQQWDTSTGRQLARFDASVYHPKTGNDGRPEVSVVRYFEGDAVAVTVAGDPRVHVIGLGQGHEITHLTTGRDTTSVEFGPGGRFLAVRREHGVTELWRPDPLRKELGPLPVVADGAGDDPHVAEFVDERGGYLVAAAGKARVYQAGDHSYGDFYYLGGPADRSAYTPYTFPGAASDGTALLYEDEVGNGGPLPLEPAVWASRLCTVIGYRDFTATERAGLPTQLPPEQVCPDPAD